MLGTSLDGGGFAKILSCGPASRAASSVQMYAMFSAEHQRALAAAYLPAARRGLGLGTGRTQAPLLMRFVTQLLQARLICTDMICHDGAR